jgi:hypothetical protein
MGELLVNLSSPLDRDSVSLHCETILYSEGELSKICKRKNIVLKLAVKY